MAKLFPPIIDGTIPAFYSEDNGTARLTVPFSLNKGVSKTSIKGIALKIKTTQSSSYLGTIEQKNSLYYNLDESPYVTFLLEHKKEGQDEQILDRLNLGQFYKIQIAFINDKGEVGYYSTVSVTKYTSLPQVTINDFKRTGINNHTYEYIGAYLQEKDVTEKAYSYEFKVYDSINNLISSSGSLLHNSQNDTDVQNNISYDSFTYASDIPLDNVYKIQYIVTTANGLVVPSPKYRIAQKTTLEPSLNADVEIETNYENGYIGILLKGHKNEYDETIPTTGAFLLSRTSDGNEWVEMSRFKYSNQWANGLLWKDFTVEQGKTYQYSIQQYNDNGLYSNRLVTESVYISFEDIFLFDGEKQLKIRYNPKVSSFKVNVLESKTDTLGSQHPYIIKNGNTYYKEFPISGLVSYFMDTDELFMNKLDDEVTTNLTDENIYKERNFKMTAYEWLTNGEPKLFRSPGEGNYLVRLMNVSMTPNDATGRMLHTFSGTAYEIADFNYKNLKKLGFIKPDEPREATIKWGSVSLFETDEQGQYLYKENEQINTYSMYTMRITDAIPGDVFNLVYADGCTEEIVIGATGSYYIDLGVEISGISMGIGNSHSGNLVYSYYTVAENKFDKISDITVTEIPTQQFIGEHDIIKEITHVYDSKTKQWVRNPKVDIVSFLDLSVHRRTLGKLEEFEGNLYYDAAHEKPFIKEEADPFTVFAIGKYISNTSNTGRYDEGGNQNYIEIGGNGNNPSVAPGRAYYKFAPEYYEDFYNEITYKNKEFEPIIQFNGEQVSVEETRDFVFNKPGICSTLQSSNGVITNVTYQLRTTDYSIEDEIHNGINLAKYKKDYEDAEEKLSTLLKDEAESIISLSTQDYVNEIKEAREKVKNTYTTFVLKLVQAQTIDEQMGV